MSSSNENESRREASDRFASTQWSLVIAAGNNQSSRADDALAILCETYWYPLYAFVRRQGNTPDDAADLTQAFFATLLEKNYVAVADRDRGRFRSFLLTALRHFLSDQRDKARARKRGGGQTILSLDFRSAEQRFNREPADTTASPERLFLRRWALTLLDHVLDRVRSEYVAGGKATVFDCLKEFLTREKDAAPYRTAAEQLGMNEAAVKTAVHRLRRRYRAVLEDEIARTVATADEAKDELRQLFAALGPNS